MNITVEEDLEPELLLLHEHWGELRTPSTSRTESDHMALANMQMKAEVPKLKMPIAEDAFDPKSLVLPPDDSLATEILKHNIRLNKHVKEVGKLLKNLERNPAEVTECPPIPVMTKRKRTERLGQTDNPVEKQRLRYSLGRTQTMPAVVDDDVIQKMLEKSVLMILAQIGYDYIDKSALLVFVDVVKEMLSKICLMSHELNQKDIIEGKAAYKDVLEKAFRSVGFSGLDCVKDYFKKTLVAKPKLAHQKSKHLTIQYNQKVAELAKRQGTSSVITVNPPRPQSSTAVVPEYLPSTSNGDGLQ